MNKFKCVGMWNVRILTNLKVMECGILINLNVCNWKRKREKEI